MQQLLTLTCAAAMCAVIAACAGPEPTPPTVTNAERKIEALSFSFRAIPAGELTTGGKGSLNPRRTFRIAPFWLAATTVTNADYERFDPAHRGQRDPISPDDDSPVTNVTYFDALRYCQWISEHFGVSARLPTSLEWEWACYGGKKGPYSFGDIPSFASQSKYAHLFSKRASPVATLPPNSYGLYDMTGNIQEMCGDAYITDAHDLRRFPGDPDYEALAARARGDLIAMKNCSARLPTLSGCECNRLYVTTKQNRNAAISFRVALSDTSGRS